MRSAFHADRRERYVILSESLLPWSCSAITYYWQVRCRWRLNCMGWKSARSSRYNYSSLAEEQPQLLQGPTFALSPAMGGLLTDWEKSGEATSASDSVQGSLTAACNDTFCIFGACSCGVCFMLMVGRDI